MSTLPIGEGTRVTLHFSLSLADGTEVDSNFGDKPATFQVGDGSLLEGFEQALFGMQAGQTDTLIIKPEQGFGERNPDNIQQLPRNRFAGDLQLEQGLVCSFADADRGELPGVITRLDSDTVTVDFNHPLAGRDIHFSVHILTVEPAVTH